MTLAIEPRSPVSPVTRGLKQATIELLADFETLSSDGGDRLTRRAARPSTSTVVDTPGSFTVTNSGRNTLITACFAAGTRTEGEFGKVPVRRLGFRRTSLAKHPSPHDAMPVRVRAGAFASTLLVRALLLSPDHAVFLDGHLVPIRHLIDGISIAQETREHITCWHLELDRHDVILAEDLPSESYLDTRNRAALESADGPTQLHPEFARASAQPALAGPRSTAMIASRTA